jgi:hypothetical protein
MGFSVMITGRTVNIILSNITGIVLNNPTYFTNVRYYANLTDANAGNNNTLLITGAIQQQQLSISE